MHRRPLYILALEPTDTLVKRFSARVSTMIRNVPQLRERATAAKSRDSRNTVQAKNFLGDAAVHEHRRLCGQPGRGVRPSFTWTRSTAWN